MKRLTGFFNTPNFENARNLIIHCTGFDPYNWWSWPTRGLPVIWVTERLGQILKVRHAFAHGFDVPPYPWTQSTTGSVRLTSNAVDDVEALLRNLVRRTDQGMRAHAFGTYGTALNW